VPVATLAKWKMLAVSTNAGFYSVGFLFDCSTILLNDSCTVSLISTGTASVVSLKCSWQVLHEMDILPSERFVRAC